MKGWKHVKCVWWIKGKVIISINIKKNKAQRIKYKEDEEYRKMKQEYNKTFQSKIVTCDVCNCSMSQAHYYRHKKTYNHQQNLKIKEIDEQEYRFLGSNLKMDKSSHFLDIY